MGESPTKPWCYHCFVGGIEQKLSSAGSPLCLFERQATLYSHHVPLLTVKIITTCLRPGRKLAGRLLQAKKK